MTTYTLAGFYIEDDELTNVVGAGRVSVSIVLPDGVNSLSYQHLADGVRPDGTVRYVQEFITAPISLSVDGVAVDLLGSSYRDARVMQIDWGGSNISYILAVTQRLPGGGWLSSNVQIGGISFLIFQTLQA